MRSLYGDDEALTDEGKKYSEQIKKAIRPILEHATAHDVRLWDFVLLVSQAVSLDVAFRIAQRRFNKENKRVP